MPLKRKRTQSETQNEEVIKTTQDLKAKIQSFLFRERVSSDQLQRDVTVARENILTFCQKILAKTEEVTRKYLNDLANAAESENGFIQAKIGELQTILGSLENTGEKCMHDHKLQVLQNVKKRLRILEPNKSQRFSFKKNDKILQQLVDLGKLRVHSTLKSKDRNSESSMIGPNESMQPMDKLPVSMHERFRLKRHQNTTIMANTEIGKRQPTTLASIDVMRGSVDVRGVCFATENTETELTDSDSLTRSISLDAISWSSHKYNKPRSPLHNTNSRSGDVEIMLNHTNCDGPHHQTDEHSGNGHNHFGCTIGYQREFKLENVFEFNIARSCMEHCESCSCSTLLTNSVNSINSEISSSYCQISGACYRRQSDVTNSKHMHAMASACKLARNCHSVPRSIDEMSWVPTISSCASSMSENMANDANADTAKTDHRETKLLNIEREHSDRFEIKLTPCAKFEAKAHRSPCVIPDITILPDMRIALADHYHNNIQLFSKDLKLICQCDCAYPMGICTIDTDTIAASLRRTGQVALFKARQTKLELLRMINVKCEYYIWNVVYKNERLYVICDENNIHVMDLNETEYKVIHSAIPTERGFIRYFDVSDNGQHIYLVEEKGMRCINARGELQWVFVEENVPELERDKRGRVLEDICYVKGRLLATDWTQSKIFEISDKGEYVRNVVTEGVNHPRAIAVMDDTVVVTQFNPNMTAQNKRTVNVFTVTRADGI